MNESRVMSVVGKTIIGQHGREIGVITDIVVDLVTWHSQSLEVKLNRETPDDLRLKRPWFRSQTVHVPVREISGATDNIVLNSLLEEMEFSGGTPADGEPGAHTSEPETTA